MPATKQDIIHYAGNTSTITIPVTDKAGAAVDLTGATAKWWMGKSVLSVDDDVYVKKNTEDGGISIDQNSPSEIGSLIVLLEEDDTKIPGSLVPKAGAYYHEAEVVVGATVSTVTTGKFTVIPTLVRNEV